MRGRPEIPRRLAGRRRLLLGGWLLGALLVVGRAAVVQLLQGPRWKELAEAQHREAVPIPAPRGAILDRNGAPLAVSQEWIRVSVAPRELGKGAEATLSRLAAALSLPKGTAAALRDPSRKWVILPGRYPLEIQEKLRGLSGVYLERVIHRFYPHPQLAPGVLGAVVDGVGTGGVEGAFEAHLRGVPGKAIQARDRHSRPIPGQTVVVAPPVPGGDVVLTLDRDLQEIGREALLAAVEETKARGGDLIVVDPKTGEILALVCLLDGRDECLTAINAPYEPGSTLKPFTVAGLLSLNLATLADSVDGENGRWTVAGRTITDVHRMGRMSLADALRESSNVGIAKMALRLSPSQQYQLLRDFGFGAPTGVEIPGEKAGTLRRPRSWSRQSPVSLAIGYEISVTPLQLTMAYAALANGGHLMEPRLIREIRAPGGEVLTRFSPREVRQVVSEAVAREVAQTLAQVVETGTGTRAQLATFRVAGKTGTSRVYKASGGYESGAYYASFVSFFPVEDPQLVVYVKLDRPRGTYYGGATAAPVTRATLEAVLAARRPPVDREALASLARIQPRSQPLPGAQFASFNPPPPPPPVRAPRTPPSDLPETGALVPDVSGLAPRLAARRLHALGFRVLLEGSGPVSGTNPPAGSPARPGDTVRILAKGGGHG